MRRLPAACMSLLLTGFLCASASAWVCPEARLPVDATHPVVTVSPGELTRLRAAYHDGVKAVTEVVRSADRAIKQPLSFPPRGSQHNQWYQCERCETALKHLGDFKHQCPSCKTIYTGPPYDDVIFARQHAQNLRAMTDAAWAWALTGERRYADYSAAVLLGYAERYLLYPHHDNRCRTPGASSGGHLEEQTLGEASDLVRYIGPAYDLIAESPSLTDEDRRAIVDKLIRPMLQNMDKAKAGKSNWQSWHNAAMFIGGAVIGEVAWMQKSLTQPHNGFAFQMQVSINPDGFWYENSWGYHFYTLAALTAHAEAARHVGLDLYSHPLFKKMFTLPARYAMPDRRLPRFGDDVRTGAFGRDELMEPAYAAYHEPALLIGLDDQPTWESIALGRDKSVAQMEAPQLGSELFSAAGHAILRPRGEAGIVAAITFAPFGGFHDHFDRLGFVLYAFGQECGVDPGRAASQAYRLPIHRNWYRATLSHNTVTVDEKSQTQGKGRCLTFAANDQYAAVGAELSGAYKGVTHRRWLIATPTYLLVFDDLTADAPHRFDFWYHNRGEQVDCETAPPDASAFVKALDYINEKLVGKIADPIRVKFTDKPITMHLLMNAESGTDVMLGDGVGSSVDDRIPLARFTRNGQHVQFAAVLEPVDGDATPAVQSITLDRAARVYTISIQRGDQTDTALISPDGPVIFDAAGTTVLQRK